MNPVFPTHHTVSPSVRATPTIPFPRIHRQRHPPSSPNQSRPFTNRHTAIIEFIKKKTKNWRPSLSGMR